jgi:hypothetical protein
MPPSSACQAIIKDTVAALATEFKRLESLVHSRELADLGKRCVGLDGRQIRKAVLAALTMEKATAADPNRLTIHDIAASIDLAKEESKHPR